MSAIRFFVCVVALLGGSSIAHGDARQLGTRPADAWIATLENPSPLFDDKWFVIYAK
jgi:hypothetical protein